MDPYPRPRYNNSNNNGLFYDENLGNSEGALFGSSGGEEDGGDQYRGPVNQYSLPPLTSFTGTTPSRTNPANDASTQSSSLTSLPTTPGARIAAAMPVRRQATNHNAMGEVVDLTESSPVNSASSSNSSPTNAAQKRRRNTPTPGPSSKKSRTENAAVIDLAEVEDEEALEAKVSQMRQEAHRAQIATQSSRLADYTCSICLDEPTNLAATPCGHIFCDECLREALQAGEPPQSKFGKCPVCRRKVGKNQIILLEMKLKVRGEAEQKA